MPNQIKNYQEEFINLFNYSLLNHKKYYDNSKYEAKKQENMMRKNKAKIKERFLGKEDEAFVNFDDERTKEKEKKANRDLLLKKQAEEVFNKANAKEKAEKIEKIRSFRKNIKEANLLYSIGQDVEARERLDKHLGNTGSNALSNNNINNKKVNLNDKYNNTAEFYNKDDNSFNEFRSGDKNIYK